MKAIAIINIPDDVSVDELCITFNLEKMLDQDGNTKIIYEGISEPLRLLPDKKNEMGKTIQDISFVVGFNACLDEILGEEE